MKDKINQNDKVNIVNQKYKEEISKEKLAKGMIVGALTVGAIGSMEALKPSQASAATLTGSQAIIGSITENIKSTEELIKESDSVYKTLANVAFDNRAKRQNNMYNYLTKMTQKNPNYNLALIKDSLDYNFVHPDIGVNLNLGTDPSYKQVPNIQINGETYTLHLFKQAALFQSTDPQYMQYLGSAPTGSWYQKLGTRLQSFMVHGLPNGNDMVLIEGAQQNPKGDIMNAIYIGER